jgi:NADPH:quinone reductase-like Zn-dependent oxidoreductase
MTTTMMALRAHTRGGPETLVFEQAPMPLPGAGEALVAVRAAGITFAELTWDVSWTTSDGRDRTPVIPSHEVSGVVAAVGASVTDLAPGDEVYGLVDFDRDGAAADYVTMPAEALAAKPRSVSHAQAAALPLAALTAWQALVDHAGLAAGETVLVHGGAGGVGALAVQLAAGLGARVTATARGEDAEAVRGFGAERVIDFTAEAFDETVAGVDVVIDPIGGDTGRRSYGVLRRGGRLINLNEPPDEAAAEKHGVRAVFFIVRPDRAELTRLAGLVDAGELRPVISQTFPLEKGRQAYESATEPGRPPGKTVLLVHGDG